MQDTIVRGPMTLQQSMDASAEARMQQNEQYPIEVQGERARATLPLSNKTKQARHKQANRHKRYNVETHPRSSTSSASGSRGRRRGSAPGAPCACRRAARRSRRCPLRRWPLRRPGRRSLRHSWLRWCVGGGDVCSCLFAIAFACCDGDFDDAIDADSTFFYEFLLIRKFSRNIRTKTLFCTKQYLIISIRASLMDICNRFAVFFLFGPIYLKTRQIFCLA